MITKNHGFVLIMTIVFLGLMSVLIISLMHSVLLYSKINNQLMYQQKSFYSLEHALSVILADKEHFKDVRAPDVSLYIKKTRYHYTVKDEGVYPCLQMSVGQERFATHHWEVSIYQHNVPLETLVVRVATTEPLVVCPSKKIRVISDGVLSWRLS